MKQMLRPVLCMLWAAGSYGADAQAPPPEALSLTVLPQNIVHDMPTQFTFALQNVSNHDFVLPQPSDCDGPNTGVIHVRFVFTPAGPDEQGMGYGCGVGGGKPMSIFDRVKTWTTLHPGQTLEMTREFRALHLTALRAGTYEFWAEYTPPDLTHDEQRALQQAGVEVPLHTVTSQHTEKFVKQP